MRDKMKSEKDNGMSEKGRETKDKDMGEGEIYKEEIATIERNRVKNWREEKRERGGVVRNMERHKQEKRRAWKLERRKIGKIGGGGNWSKNWSKAFACNCRLITCPEGAAVDFELREQFVDIW